MNAIILLLMVIFSTTLKASDPPRPTFPNDSKPMVQTEDKALIDAICPGSIEKEGKVACAKGCPSFTGLGRAVEDLDWTLVRIKRGHFISPASDDAVVSTEGCEPHAANYGGSILLTRNNGQWSTAWYKSGIITSQCHKIRAQDRREILVCMGQYGATGYLSTVLYVEDLLNPRGIMMGGDAQFFELTDTTQTCGFSQLRPVIRAFLEKVEFKPAALSVTASVGRKPFTAAETEVCSNGQSVPTPVRSYHLEFRFDGHDFKPTAGSAGTVKLFHLP